MVHKVGPAAGAMALVEMKEFASFPAGTQRYIRRSLDVGLKRGDVHVCWARNVDESAEIDAQARRYRMLDLLRACVPDDIEPEDFEPFMAPLITLSAGDLRDGKLVSFEAYRFLYERLIGPEVRPWLVSAFCAAASLPGVHPHLRKQLLQSIPVLEVVAAGWSIQAPQFYPEWVEKVPEAVS